MILVWRKDRAAQYPSPRTKTMTTHEIISTLLLSRGRYTFKGLMRALSLTTGMTDLEAAEAVGAWLTAEGDRVVLHEGGEYGFVDTMTCTMPKVDLTLVWERLPGEVSRVTKLPTLSEPWTHYYVARNGWRLVPVNWLDDTYRLERPRRPDVQLTLKEGLDILRNCYAD